MDGDLSKQLALNAFGSYDEGRSDWILQLTQRKQDFPGVTYQSFSDFTSQGTLSIIKENSGGTGAGGIINAG